MLPFESEIESKSFPFITIMGAGASVAMADFGPFGDVNAVKSLCVEVEKEFDQAKFDELKVRTTSQPVLLQNALRTRDY